ncbi:MAG TPA: cell division protein ZapA [Desulfopila sp.]|nr:cell division protein ZapA [Desulfopila sp.]
MTERERLVRFTLLGQDYAFYTGASEEELTQILDLVKNLLQESGSTSQSGTIASSKQAILACLNIASRYIRLQQDFDEYIIENKRRVSSIADTIETVLEVEKREGGR